MSNDEKKCNTDLDWDKPLQTRDGRHVRLLATDLVADSRPMVVAIRHSSGHRESVYTRTRDGKQYSTDRTARRSDIINVPPPVTKVYVNLYHRAEGHVSRGGVIIQGYGHSSLKSAESVACTCRQLRGERGLSWDFVQTIEVEV